VSAKQIYGDRDKEYFQRLEKERFGLTAPTATYFSLNRGKNVDPLYNEPRGWDFEEFCVQVAIEYQEMEDRTPEVREEGFGVEYDAMAYVAMLEWNENAPAGRSPKEGDVIFIQKQYFDVVKGNSGGNVVDRPDFAGFRLDLRKRIKFDAKRKVSPQHKSAEYP